MRGKVYALDRYRRVQFRIPLDAHPNDRFLPVCVLDQTLQTVEIIKNDLVAANVAVKRVGRLSIAKTVSGLYFGFYFVERRNIVRLEPVCACPDCLPYYLTPAEILDVGPIVRIYRKVNGVSFDFSYQKEREPLWNP